MPLTARAVRRDGEGDLDRFRSIALYSQLKLGELFGDPSSRDGFGDRRPTVAETAVCAHILQEIANVPSAFHEVLSQAADVLLASVYSDQLMSGIDVCERVPYYEIVDRLQTEKDGWSAKHGELSVQLESVEDGRRVEAAGGQVLRKKCDDLSREVAALKEKHANQAELIRRLEATCANFEESEEYLKDLAGNEGAASRPGTAEEDVTAKKLKKATEAYKRASVEVEQLRYQLSFMVDRQELMDMTAERDRLEQELNEKTMAHRVLNLKFEKAFADLMSLRRKESQRTPRPDWDAAVKITKNSMDLDVASQSTASIVPILCEKISHLSREIEDMSQSGIELNRIRSILDGTDDDVDLLGELTAGTYGKYTLQPDPEMPTHWIACGIDLSVPRYVRHEGRVRNRKFKKSEIDKMVKGFWTQKVTYDEAKKEKEIDTMAEFVYVSFMKIYGKDMKVVSEWTYSILDGLERFMAEEPHFRLFKHVVRNRPLSSSSHSKKQTEALSPMSNADHG